MKAAARRAAWPGPASTTLFFGSTRGARFAPRLMLQYLPFCDREAVGLLNDFERAVYSNT